MSSVSPIFPEDPEHPVLPGKERWGVAAVASDLPVTMPVGLGRAVAAGGMVYVSSIGPIDPETGHLVPGTITDQTRQCLKNLTAKLEAMGSSLDKVVWANWSLRDPAEFDAFNAELARWFPGDSPIGQGTLMPPLQRRAGFRVSIGAIAEA